jgi:FAD/FMN-containing dehydrogenase
VQRGRRYGYAADHVRTIEVVTADGELRIATEQQNPDLFWAVRGGKGNFGVVTAIEVGLVPVTRIYGGGLYFPAQSTREVLHLYRRWAVGMPDELSSSFLMAVWPDSPELPAPVRGRFALHLRTSYLGPPADGARLVAPLRAVATPLIDTVTDMPYTDVASIHNDLPEPGAYHINNFHLTELDHDTVEAILEVAAPGSDGLVGIEVRHLGGALARTPSVPNAVTARRRRFSSTPQVSWGLAGTMLCRRRRTAS